MFHINAEKCQTKNKVRVKLTPQSPLSPAPSCDRCGNPDLETWTEDGATWCYCATCGSRWSVARQCGGSSLGSGYTGKRRRDKTLGSELGNDLTRNTTP